jgi:cytochrome P450
MIRLLTPRSDGARLIDSVHTVGDALITELLRLDGPAQAVIRTATDTHVVGGITIRAGEAAVVVLAAANRDPAAYTDPAQFLAKRAGPPPLAFGHGAHYCLGVALARLETAVALEHLLVRQPALGGTSIWRDNTAIRGPETVPVVFEAPET